jgi:hypothetical protein
VDNQYGKFGFWALVHGAICCSFSTIAYAQVIPDRTLGDRNSIIVPNAEICNGRPIDRIDGSAFV